MPTLVRLVALVLLAAAPAFAQVAATKPAWFVAHVDFMSRDGGTWIATNPDGDADPNAPDAFGMEWRAAYDGHVLVGRLYGIEDGRETNEYWTYREFWHPGRQVVVIEQWGGPGVYGVGETTSSAPQRTEIVQTFWLPDGRDWRDGHRNFEDGDSYLTAQFDILDDGQWRPNGSYTWRRVRPAP